MGSLPDPTREEFDEVRRRKDSYHGAILTLESRLEAAEREIDKWKGECLRLSAELEASSKSNQLLAGRNDATHDGLVAEVQYLRELCLSNGVNPNR